ncbi:MAG TPA: DUF167 domain-containing protein [Pirellulales bacterium]|jgi:hypothetical protein|nr:DUF167 domain-containing protein [Pirellulales bacterium]
MIEIEPHSEGVTLSVRAQTRAAANAVRGEVNGALKVSVTQVAEKGKANQAVIEVLAEALGLRRSQVRLISGPTSTQKRFLIRGVTSEQLQQKLAAALADTAR